jgi:hypothetical protein
MVGCGQCDIWSSSHLRDFGYWYNRLSRRRIRLRIMDVDYEHLPFRKSRISVCIPSNNMAESKVMGHLSKFEILFLSHDHISLTQRNRYSLFDWNQEGDKCLYFLTNYPYLSWHVSGGFVRDLFTATVLAGPSTIRYIHVCISIFY